MSSPESDSNINRRPEGGQPDGNEPTSSVLELVGGRVRELREERGLSQRQLARECGVSSGHLSLLERGIVLPTVRTLETLAARLEVEVFDLLVSPEGPLRSRIVAATARLGPDQLERVAAFIEEILDDPPEAPIPPPRPPMKIFSGEGSPSPSATPSKKNVTSRTRRARRRRKPTKSPR